MHSGLIHFFHVGLAKQLLGDQSGVKSNRFLWKNCRLYCKSYNLKIVKDNSRIFWIIYWLLQSYIIILGYIRTGPWGHPTLIHGIGNDQISRKRLESAPIYHIYSCSLCHVSGRSPMPVGHKPWPGFFFCVCFMTIPVAPGDSPDPHETENDRISQKRLKSAPLNHIQSCSLWQGASNGN